MSITSTSDYIENLAQPHEANVRKDARIATAQNDQQASQAEAAAAAITAEAQRDSAIKRAGFEAETNKAAATAAQAGPLAEAEAKRAVVTAETEIANLEAQREARRLETSVQKPADAKAYATRALAEADRDATIANAEAQAAQTSKIGEAEATATRARGTAEADVLELKGKAEGAALTARAQGLSEHQDAVIAQQVAALLPEIVRAIADPLGKIDNMTVLSGAEGVTGTIANVATQAAVLIPTLMSLTKGLMPASSDDSAAAAPAVAIQEASGV
jgi:hypothetical protein